MPDIYQPIETREMQPIQRMPVPLTRYLSTAGDMGANDSVLSHLLRISDDHDYANDPKSATLTADEANQKYGIDDLKFKQPVKESMAQAMSQRKRDQMDQQMILCSGKTAGRILPGMAMNVLGATANPVDFASMFIPFTGEAKIGKMAFGLRSVIAASKIPAPRLVESMAQGMLWQSTVGEIPRIIEAHQENQPVEGIGVDILGQGLFAAGLHGAGLLLKKLNPRDRETMAKTAMNQFLNDEDIHVHDMPQLSDDVLKHDIMARDEQLRNEAARSVDDEKLREAVFEKYREHPEKAAIMIEDGQGGVKIHTGAFHGDAYGHLTKEEWDKIASGEYGAHEGFTTTSGRFVDRNEAAQMVGMHEHLTAESMHDETSDPDWLSHNERTYFDNLKEGGATDAEAMNMVRAYRYSNQRAFFFDRPENQEKLEHAREAAIADYIEKKKQDATKIDPMVKQHMEPSVSPEDLQKYSGDDKALERSLDEDITSLKKSPEFAFHAPVLGVAPGKKPMAFYNIKEPIFDKATGELLHDTGSSVSENTLRKNGIEVPEAPEMNIGKAVDEAVNCMLAKLL